MAPEFRRQNRPPILRLPFVSYLTEPFIQLLAFLTKLLPTRLTAHDKPAATTRPATTPATVD